MSKPAEFPAYVRSVEGHLVPRPDGGGRSYFGAHVATFEERRTGSESIVWDTEKVTPLTAQFLGTYQFELAGWLRTGALKKATADEYSKWVEIEAARDAKANPEPAAATEQTDENSETEGNAQ